jgi:ADP-heptose:LPS heptosyltransferase
MEDKIYFTFGGGLGDVLYTYLGGKNYWGYLASFKKEYPNAKIKVLSSTHNPQTLELIKYNPYIDSMKELGWVNDSKELFKKNSEGYTRVTHRMFKNLEFRTPAVYINEDDAKAVENIQKQGPYMFLHPFAGLKDREPISTEKYFGLIDYLIDYLNIKVVVIGANHNRTNLKSIWKMKEEFNYKRDGLHNLVGKTNIRAAIKLAEKAVGFIGCWSCYANLFWIHKKKSLVFTSKEKKEKLMSRFQKGQRWYNHGICRVLSVNDKLHNKIITDEIEKFYDNEIKYINR